MYHAASDTHGYYAAGSDAGNLTLSWHPIVKSSFHKFEYPALGDDILAIKGVLYAKIDLSSVGGSALHIFNIHAQATYIDDPNRYWAEQHVTRYHQIKEAQEFISRKVFNEPGNYDITSDIVIFAGDFNVSSATYSIQEQDKLKLVEREPYAKPILPLLKNEYKCLIKTLTGENNKNGPKCSVIDLLRQSVGNGTSNPITHPE